MSFVTHLWSTVVLEPNPLARFAVQALLARASLHIAHAGDDADEAVQCCLDADAGVFLTELVLPQRNFFEIARRLLSDRPQLRIVVFTWEQDGALLRQARDAGACAILSKYSEPENLGTKIAATRRGALLLDETTAPLILGTSETTRLPALSGREIDVLRMLGEGSKMTTISRTLGLAESTVKSHAAKAAAKLQVTNSKDAVREARRLGLLAGGEP